MVKLNNLNPPGQQAFTDAQNQSQSQFQQAQTPLNNQQTPKGLFKIPENLLPLIP
jgi:hypothetical protein